MLHTDATLDFDRWRDAISEDFVPLDALPSADGTRGDRPFVGGLRSTRMGEVILSEVSGDSVEVARTGATIRRSDPGTIKVGLQVEGTGLVTQAGREATLRPGEFTVYDTTDTYRLRFDGHFRMFVVMFSRAALHLQPGSLRDGVVRRFGPDDEIGTVLAPFLHGLRRSAQADRVPESTAVEHALYDLVGAAFDTDGPAPASTETLVVRGDSLIDARLADAALCPAQIAAALHVSVRHLQKVYESDGRTVTGSIRRRRLERCAADLSNPALARKTVAEIGARHGITDASRLSRQFREAYGVPPNRYRLSTG